jgi:uncharacterized protein YkwD
MFFRFLKFCVSIFFILLILIILKKDSRDFLFEQLRQIQNPLTDVRELYIDFLDFNRKEDASLDEKPVPLVVQNNEEFVDNIKELSSQRVFLETNNERVSSGISPLVQNDLLKKAAMAKIDDMFHLQYFEHVSPTGKTPAMLVSEVGYTYLTTGENLALGVFKTEKDLVKAWMDSPGHRANILGKQFSEIGIAIKKGDYKGKTVFFAVQEFGKPLSLCPEPDPVSKGLIADTNKEISILKNKIDQARSEIEKANNEKQIDAYNNLVKEYNKIIVFLEQKVKDYNQAVLNFNECVKKETKK